MATDEERCEKVGRKICDMSKNPVQGSTASLYTLLLIPKELWINLFADFIIGLPWIKRINDFIFVVVDQFSKISRIIVCYKTDNECHIDSLIFKETTKLHSIPRTITLDKDAKFLGKFCKTLWAKLATEFLFSTCSHPQTDGQTEIVNRTLSALLRTIIKKNTKSWEECLSHIEFAYHRTIHFTSQYSPFKVVYSFNPLTLLDLSPLPMSEHVNLDGKKKVEFVKNLHEKVHLNIEKRMEKYVKQTNKGQRRMVFELGYWVWLYVTKERFPVQRYNKLLPLGDNPFQVVEHIKDNACKL